jgi:hypothetical protein
MRAPAACLEAFRVRAQNDSDVIYPLIDSKIFTVVGIFIDQADGRTAPEFLIPLLVKVTSKNCPYARAHGPVGDVRT